MVDATLFAQYVTNGLVLGSILALAGIGLTLVYGILNLSNFAHGDLLTLGAFMSFHFAVTVLGDLPAYGFVVALVAFAVVGGDYLWKRRLGGGERVAALAFAGTLLLASAALAASGDLTGSTNLVVLVAALLSVAAVGGIVAALDLMIWRPLRRRRAKILTLMLVSIGLALVIRNSLHLWQGADLHSYQRPAVLARRLLGVQITDEKLFVLVASIVLIVAVHLLLKHTRMGKAMRATADNPDLARVSGIDTDRVIMYVWLLGGGLTAVAGVFYVFVLDNAMTVNMGYALLLPMFAAVILGGIGSPYGAMAGGFLVGVAMKTSAIWLGTAYEPATAFVLLILVILIRPQGIFGGRIA